MAEIRNIDFVFFDAGGGHRAAANALKTVIDQQQRPWAIRMVNFQEVLDELDIFRKIAGIRLQDVYNLILKKGWTLGSPQALVFMHWLIRLYHPAQVRVLERFWSASRPHLVVSLIPNFPRALYRSLHSVHPHTPLVTILTDFADYPPHFWIEPRQQQYLICGSEKACRQAQTMGYGSDRVFRVSGMILHPRFYAPLTLDKQAERRKLGLDPARPTGLLLFGGQGSPVMRSILGRLEKAETRAQFIAVCGKNEKLRAQLSARRWSMPVFVEGFTSEIPYYMRLSDFFIGKPGPGSISEAIAMHLPVIVERNAWTLPQERYNAQWVEEMEVGLVLNNFNRIAPAVEQLLAEGRLERYGNNTARLENRAVFEIPQILEKLLTLEPERIGTSHSQTH
ncbi:MAG: galactosyldiacylglycerol synthase [Bryobacterales bacterium]|nr:galactosyldiacylglycerol synthase [Bryobacterales bacterium]